MSSELGSPIVTKFTISLGLGPRQVSYIGLTAAAWSYIEWKLTRITEAMLKIGPKEARVIGSAMSALEKTKVARLIATLAITDDSLRKGLNALLDRADAARPKRNDIVHGLWGKDADGKMHLVRMKGGPNDINRIKLDPRAMTDDDFRDIATEIADLAADLHGWYEAHARTLNPTKLAATKRAGRKPRKRRA